MIDLIIPYYNNEEGLKQTLDSIDSDIFYITIVDDNSDYTPWCPKAHQVFRYNNNCGPGFARQIGIDKTSNEWIMFIDTGDIFLKNVSQQIIQSIEENADANMISFPYIYKDKITDKTDNRMHGKIYKRTFLEKYGITFAPTSSYMNEDIGFNRTCRLCTEADGKSIIYKKTPIIKWIENTNSLTQKDNGAVLYKNQTRALSFVSLHTIRTCWKNNINAETEINQIAIALYYWFIRTAAERPEYLLDAWYGAKIFYDYFEKEIDPNKLLLGNNYIKRCLQYARKINFPINILRFKRDMEMNNMKTYVTPIAEKLEFSYDENITASSGHKYRLYTDNYYGCRETETDIWVDDIN